MEFAHMLVTMTFEEFNSAVQTMSAETLVERYDDYMNRSTNSPKANAFGKALRDEIMARLTMGG